MRSHDHHKHDRSRSRSRSKSGDRHRSKERREKKSRPSKFDDPNPAAVPSYTLPPELQAQRIEPVRPQRRSRWAEGASQEYGDNPSMGKPHKHRNIPITINAQGNVLFAYTSLYRLTSPICWIRKIARLLAAKYFCHEIQGLTTLD